MYTTRSRYVYQIICIRADCLRHVCTSNLVWLHIQVPSKRSNGKAPPSLRMEYVVYMRTIGLDAWFTDLSSTDALAQVLRPTHVSRQVFAHAIPTSSRLHHVSNTSNFISQRRLRERSQAYENAEHRPERKRVTGTASEKLKLEAREGAFYQTC